MVQELSKQADRLAGNQRVSLLCGPVHSNIGPDERSNAEPSCGPVSRGGSSVADKFSLMEALLSGLLSGGTLPAQRTLHLRSA